MRVLCWNVQGLGNTCTLRALISHVRTEKPNINFLSETKLTNTWFNMFKHKLGFLNGFGVDRKGLEGGLTLLWKDDITVSL